MIDKLFVEDLKRANPIEQIIAETPGFSTTGHGRYLTAKGDDGHAIVVDTHNGSYHWHARDEHGDVINWVKNRYNYDFQSAAELLCKRAGITPPNWKQESSAERIAYKNREDIFDVAVSVFERELWNTPAAVEYVKSRGWTDETIRSARLGYTGDMEDRSRMVKEMSDAIVLAGGDPRSVAGVTMVGFNGDVKRWLHDHDLDEHPGWIEQGFIPSFVARDLLVYPHFQYGHCVFFSGRFIKEHLNADNKPMKSINLPKILAGEKQLYFNWQCSPREKQLIIVEGQADAITIGQWGYPAVALCGVAFKEDTAKLLGARDDRRDVDFYLALDSDGAGTKATDKVADLLGPMVRLINWKGVGGINTFIDPVSGEEKEVKDANDLLRGMQS